MVLDPKRAANGIKHPSELDFDLLCDCGAKTLTIDYIVNDPKFHASPSFPLHAFLEETKGCKCGNLYRFVPGDLTPILLNTSTGKT